MKKYSSKTQRKTHLYTNHYAKRYAKSRLDTSMANLYMELTYYSGVSTAVTGSGLFERLQAQDPKRGKALSL